MQAMSSVADALTQEELGLLDAYWRAANYLSVGQIYLLDNPLLREPLQPEHVKPRLLGHFGTVPGLNLVYAHLNRAIRARDLDAIFVTGPGHGGPANVANAYLEGTYSELYPNVGEGEDGLRELFRQFSYPGGIPSHAAPETPGSIHEGGELGYALVHAFGAAFDNPDLVVACVVGDGEAETGPLAASWHSNKFLNPRRDGAVLPILHLNGWKIANPTVLARIPESELESLFEGYGWEPIFVSGGFDGEKSQAVHERFAAALDRSLDAIAQIQEAARQGGELERPRWPMLVLRTPKGWTGPREVDGVPIEGTWRSHQVPLAGVRESADQLRRLEDWMRSYRPEELFDEEGRLLPELAAQAPAGDRRMSANPHANGGLLLRDLVLPDFRDYAVEVEKPATTFSEATRVLGGFLRDVIARNEQQLPSLRPGRDGLEPARRCLLGHGSHLAGGDGSGRRASLPGRPGDGDPLRAPLPGLARGLPADGPPRALQLLRGVHPHRRLDVQPAREVAQGDRAHPLAAPDRLTQLPAQLPRLAAGPQRLLAPGSRLHRPRREQEGGGDPGLPAARREHAALGRRPLPAQPQLRQRDRRRQAAGTQLPFDRRRDPALHARARDLGLGVERRGRRARRRPGLRRRHADARDAGGGRTSCASGCPS